MNVFQWNIECMLLTEEGRRWSRRAGVCGTGAGSVGETRGAIEGGRSFLDTTVDLRWPPHQRASACFRGLLQEGLVLQVLRPRNKTSFMRIEVNYYLPLSQIANRGSSIWAIDCSHFSTSRRSRNWLSSFHSTRSFLRKKVQYLKSVNARKQRNLKYEWNIKWVSSLPVRISGRVLLMLRCLRRAHSLDADNATLHWLVVRFVLYFQANEQSELLKEVLFNQSSAFLPSSLDKQSLSSFNQLFLQKHSHSLPHFVSC